MTTIQRIFVFALCCVTRLCCAEPVTIGERFHLDSEQMGERRAFLVHTPSDYVFSKEAYPVLVVLDGDDHFAHVSAAVDFLSQQERIPKMIVVGVPNTDRGRDLSPPVEGEAPAAVGGPDKFLAFLGEELIPEVNRRYRTRSYRVIAGHSIGGLFALYSLVAAPDLFNGFIAVTPAFNNEDGLAPRFAPFLVANKSLRADLFMTLANERGQNLGGAYEMAGLLQEKASRELRWEFRRYPEETHGSVSMRSVYDGLQAIFGGYYIHDPFALFDQGGFTALEKNYLAVSDRLGFEVSIPERVLIATVLGLESRSRFDEATSVGNRAIELYPTSAYLHTYVGRIYRRMGNDDRSVEHLTKALQNEPSFGYARMLLKERNVDTTAIVPHVTLPKGDRASYIGGYGPTGDIEIVDRGGTLFAKMLQREYALQATSDSKFYLVNGEGTLVFQKNARGRIESVKLQKTGVELRKR
jgi:predicted alpha/beta superfamily hydrolase